MSRTPFRRWATAGATLAVIDALWATVLQLLYDRPVLAVWNGVASTAFGAGMLGAGMRGTAIGLAMHVTVAAWWSAVWVFVEGRTPALQRGTATLAGAYRTGAVYGPLIWVAMSCVVVPLMTGRPPAITDRWFIQLAGHALFVGPPIVVGARR